MIEITTSLISPEQVVNQAKTSGSGCVATYIGLIRDNSQGKPVRSMEYADPDGSAQNKLEEIAREARGKWKVQDIAISHRIGTLKVGDINLVVAVSAAHRAEGFAACQYIIDRFKAGLPTQKEELFL